MELWEWKQESTQGGLKVCDDMITRYCLLASKAIKRRTDTLWNLWVSLWVIGKMWSGKILALLIDNARNIKAMQTLLDTHDHFGTCYLHWPDLNNITIANHPKWLKQKRNLKATHNCQIKTKKGWERKKSHMLEILF